MVHPSFYHFKDFLSDLFCEARRSLKCVQKNFQSNIDLSESFSHHPWTEIGKFVVIVVNIFMNLTTECKKGLQLGKCSSMAPQSLKKFVGFFYFLKLSKIVHFTLLSLTSS